METNPYVDGVLQPGWRLDETCDHDMAPCPFHPPVRDEVSARQRRYLEDLQHASDRLMHAAADEARALVERDRLNADPLTPDGPRYAAATGYRRAADLAHQLYQEVVRVHVDFLADPTG